MLFIYYLKLAKFTSEIVPAKPKALAHFLLVKSLGTDARLFAVAFETCDDMYRESLILTYTNFGELMYHFTDWSA